MRTPGSVRVDVRLALVVFTGGNQCGTPSLIPICLVMILTYVGCMYALGSLLETQIKKTGPLLPSGVS